MRALFLMVISTTGFIVIPAAAAAQTASYRGPHPVDLDGHWHVEDGVHEHGELIVGMQPFGEAGGVRIFLGDPIAFGWDGEVWTFRGAHPLPRGVPGYCGLSRDHRHPFAPEGRFRRASNGVHVYIGGMRGGVAMVRPERVTPRQPIVTAPPIVSPGPYWFWGCQYQLLPGTRGASIPTALVPGCVPRTSSPSASRRGRAGRRPTATPGSTGSWFDGNYSRFRSVDGRGPGSSAPPVQRR